MPDSVVILGVFVVDTTYTAGRLPKIAETIIGSGFSIGPGGKGSNQAVACARAGAKTHFITKLGKDAFADIGLKLWKESGVVAEVTRSADSYTGAACIFLEEGTGENAIVVCPGIAGEISVQDIQGKRKLIESAGVLMTQLEQPFEAAKEALEIASGAGATTILNPAPADERVREILGLCSFVTPNETEARHITGMPVYTVEEAERAARALVDMGAGGAVVTLGEQGALYFDGKSAVHVEPFSHGSTVDTTGAGDAFNGGFAAALARGLDPLEALRCASATAGISVTRNGAAHSMPTLEEVEQALG